MDKRPIGIFDSGVGGITVLSEIQKQLPNEDLIYLGDTKNFPYGDKSKETIINMAIKCTQFLLHKEVKLIIIACGTATSQSLEEIKKRISIPVIGIIEPTIEEIKKTNIHKTELRIGVLATEGTIKSNKWEQEIKKQINNAIVISKACPLLAPMAEQVWIENTVAQETIKEYMKPFHNQNINKLVLGCTHYPLFKKLIQKELGNKVEIINTGEKIAMYLEDYLNTNDVKNTPSHHGLSTYYLTDTECNFIQVAKKLLQNEKIEDIQKVNIE